MPADPAGGEGVRRAFARWKNQIIATKVAVASAREKIVLLIAITNVAWCSTKSEPMPTTRWRWRRRSIWPSIPFGDFRFSQYSKYTKAKIDAI